jgi:thiosulfate/3-mercaptopyruvate sulfurtransferase
MGPLISVAELAARLADPRLRICDIRWSLARPAGGREAYDAGHIPGAIFMDLDRVLAAPPGPGRHPLPDPDMFTRALGVLGIGTHAAVVAYDDADGSIAARLWWMLDSLGHEDVAVLDGGLAAWTDAGQPLSTDPVTLPPTTFERPGPWRRTIDRHELRRRLAEAGTPERDTGGGGADIGRGGADATRDHPGARPLRLLDVRAPERYRGEVEPIDPVAGHIPAAISAPYSGNTDASGRFLPREALAARYRALAGDGDIAVQCGSGVNASQAALAMRIAGLPDPLLYPGSYSDWSRAGWPVATGSEPGAPLEAEPTSNDAG